MVVVRIKWTNVCEALRALHIGNFQWKLEITLTNTFSWLNSFIHSFLPSFLSSLPLFLSLSLPLSSSFFSFLATLWHVEAPMPGIRPEPQLWSTPHLWQRWSLNQLCWARDWSRDTDNPNVPQQELLNSKINVSWGFLLQRALSKIRDSIFNKNGTVTMAAFSVSLHLTSPGKKPKGSKGEPMLPSRPRASWLPDLRQERKDFHSLPACSPSPCSGHPLSRAFCLSRFLFPVAWTFISRTFMLFSPIILCLEYFFLPESPWQTPACPSKLTSFLWPSLPTPHPPPPPSSPLLLEGCVPPSLLGCVTVIRVTVIGMKVAGRIYQHRVMH